ncbi:MAG: nitrogenase iron-molybdenum cofactor biosynthesis protein NifE [Methanophagales archaeon]|nr:nitrogenase iron-molybdenum cofactor biosynthesis protein NifE [Methanophagales archaeon]
MPITDAVHLVHGPVGCAAYIWDIRGSRSSKSNLYRTGFSTNLQEREIIFGGEEKLYHVIIELYHLYHPPVIFVYATCVVGLIGDDLAGVCRKAEEATGCKCRVIPVQSEGFRGVKKSPGHKLACDVLLEHLIGTRTGRGETDISTPNSINILGEYNVAGDVWSITPLFEAMGIRVVSVITGDSTVDEIASAHTAALNIVQCQKSIRHLARRMDERYGIPSIDVNFFGITQTAKALTDVAEFFMDKNMQRTVEEMVSLNVRRITPKVEYYKKRLAGKRAAIYVGGSKAWSLIDAFSELGMEVILTGTQNGLPEDYVRIREHVAEGTVIIDDANVRELAELLEEYRPDVLVSGAKEKYLSLKLGIPFCDFNHGRTTPFAGFDGFLNFAREIHGVISSPVWDLIPERRRL